ncbi:MAG: TerB family tellurite resistance protein [Bacteroidales bacterium]|nr:TerB family tellurite resistance protein [Bacteroidales bacterium]
MGIGKYLAGAGLGWAFGGPIGALIGIGIASVTDSIFKTDHQTAGFNTTTRGDFAISFVVLTASIMKADGKVLKSELDFVKKYFVQFFGESQAIEMLTLLRDVLKKQIDINAVSEQIQQYMNYESRLQVLHFLFGIALADGHFAEIEIQTIGKIAKGMGITQGDYDSIRNMYIADTDSDYKILEIDPSASDDEIKKAYKKMAIKFHPDKVSYLGEEAQKAAEEKFKKLNQAYENIKKQRNIK